MVQREIVCDKCECAISSHNTKEESAKLQLWGPGEYRGTQGQRIDLCMKCYLDLVKFLENKDIAGPE